MTTVSNTGVLIPLLVVLSATAAMGQSRLDGSETPAQLRERHADYLKQCMRDWDAATHMTKQEWAHTCRRVVDNRVKYLIDRSKQSNSHPPAR